MKPRKSAEERGFERSMSSTSLLTSRRLVSIASLFQGGGCTKERNIAKCYTSLKWKCYGHICIIMYIYMYIYMHIYFYISIYLYILDTHTYICTYTHIHMPVDVQYRFTDCLSLFSPLSLSLTIPGVRKRTRFLLSLLYFMVMVGIVMLAVANQQLGRIGIFHDGNFMMV